MLEKKILGSVLKSTMDSFKITELCELTNSKKADVEKVIEKLLKSKKIVKKGNKYKVKIDD